MRPQKSSNPIIDALGSMLGTMLLALFAAAAIVIAAGTVLVLALLPFVFWCGGFMLLGHFFPDIFVSLFSALNLPKAEPWMLGIVMGMIVTIRRVRVTSQD